MALLKLPGSAVFMSGPIFVTCDPPCRFVATPAASGPWIASQCHGGAPAGLLAHMAEAQASDGPMSVARFTVDFLRPTPIDAALEVRTKVVRAGRQARAIELELVTDERILARATALLVRQAEVPGNLNGPTVEPRADGPPCPIPGGFSEQFSILPRLGGFGRLGPAHAWFRLESPLIDQERPNAIARAVASADFGSGIAADLSFEDWNFPSLDLSVGFVRPPEGEWILLESQWLPHAAGRTVCVTVLGDCAGTFGHATHSVLINPRFAQT